MAPLLSLTPKPGLAAGAHKRTQPHRIKKLGNLSSNEWICGGCGAYNARSNMVSQSTNAPAAGTHWMCLQDHQYCIDSADTPTKPGDPEDGGPPKSDQSAGAHRLP